VQRIYRPVTAERCLSRCRFIRFQNIPFTSLSQTNKRTDRQTGQVENLCLRSVYWRTNKNSIIMFADGNGCVREFYDAERVLSAIAKFLVHRLREREGRSEMRGKRGKERQWEEKERIWRDGKWECRKNIPKTQHIWYLGTPF